MQYKDKTFVSCEVICKGWIVLSWQFRREDTHHSNSIGGQQFLRAHGSDVGNVSKNINKSHQGNGDEDCTRQVSAQRQRGKSERK